MSLSLSLSLSSSSQERVIIKLTRPDSSNTVQLFFFCFCFFFFLQNLNLNLSLFFLSLFFYFFLSGCSLFLSYLGDWNWYSLFYLFFFRLITLNQIKHSKSINFALICVFLPLPFYFNSSFLYFITQPKGFPFQQLCTRRSRSSQVCLPRFFLFLLGGYYVNPKFLLVFFF